MMALTCISLFDFNSLINIYKLKCKKFKTDIDVKCYNLKIKIITNILFKNIRKSKFENLKKILYSIVFPKYLNI